MNQEQQVTGTPTHVTIGQIAYNAYCNQSGWKSLASGADLPQFADTKPEIQAAWEVAAQAVLDWHTPCASAGANAPVEKAA